MLDFRIITNTLQNMGFYDFVLPFLFVMTLIFGILEYTRILGRNKVVNLSISVISSFFAVAYTPFGPYLSNILAYSTIFIVGVFVFLLILGSVLMGGGTKKFGNGEELNGLQIFIRKYGKVFAGLGIIIVSVVFFNSGGGEFLYSMGIDIEEYIPYGVFLLIGGAVFWYIKSMMDEDHEEVRSYRLAKRKEELDRKYGPFNGDFNLFGGHRKYDDPEYIALMKEYQKEYERKHRHEW